MHVLTYDVDELYHCHPELHVDCVSEIANWANQRVVSLPCEQVVHKSQLIRAAET